MRLLWCDCGRRLAVCNVCHCGRACITVVVVVVVVVYWSVGDMVVVAVVVTSEAVREVIEVVEMVAPSCMLLLLLLRVIVLDEWFRERKCECIEWRRHLHLLRMMLLLFMLPHG